MIDRYRTVARSARAEHRDRGSRFIAEAFGVDSVEAAEHAIDLVRRREHAASHHCVAYRLGSEGASFRYDDDGEPSGTAGLPILRQLEARQLANTLVVVTRYFGGTKLGTGGLMRAYAQAASEVLAAAGEVEREVRGNVRVTFRYEDTAIAMQALARFDARVEASEYSDVSTLVVSVPASRVVEFSERFFDMMAGRGQVHV